MKNINPLGLFDEQFLLERLTKLKDPLVKLEEHVKLEYLCSDHRCCFLPTGARSKMGRPPFDRVMMFKLLFLQSLYNLSDDQVEYQITDRRSFMRFLGLKSSDKIPDSKTIWKFREMLIQEKVVEVLFYRFNHALDNQLAIAITDQIVDASILEVHQQLNTRDENKQIKKEQNTEAWKSKPNKLCEKDTVARWFKKNGMNFYGYKNHTKIDHGTKLISAYADSVCCVNPRFSITRDPDR